MIDWNLTEECRKLHNEQEFHNPFPSPNPWCPPSLLYNGYRIFFVGVKQPERGLDNTSFWGPSRPSYPVLGLTTFLTFTVTTSKCYSGDQIRNSVMEGNMAHNTDTRDAYRILVGRPKGKIQLGRSRRSGMIILKLGFKKWVRRHVMLWSGSR